MISKNYEINNTQINIHDDYIPKTKKEILLLQEMLNNTCLNIINNMKKQIQSIKD